MAKKTIEKLREKTTEDLQKELIKERNKFQQLKFDLVRGKVKNSAAVRDSKRRVARLSTIIKERKTAEINS